MLKVVVVTVTFNSSNYLLRLIQSLKNQTYPIYKIIVVDNNSNEEHRNIIKNLKDENGELIDIDWLQDNTGGAGGIAAGMKRMQDSYKADWMWIMDDDAFPTENCLEKLLEGANQLDNIGFVAPLIYGVENKRYQLYHHKMFNGNLIEATRPIKDISDINGKVEIEANAFVGPLFPVSVVNDMGIAKAGLFIYGDDTEFTYRITRKYKGYVIGNAVINHRDPGIAGNNFSNPKAWWKDYYEIRNNVLFIKEFASNNVEKYKYETILLGNIIKKIVKVIIKNEYKGYRSLRIRLLLKAYNDGLHEVYGKTIDPVKYAKYVEGE